MKNKKYIKIHIFKLVEENATCNFSQSALSNAEKLMLLKNATFPKLSWGDVT